MAAHSLRRSLPWFFALALAAGSSSAFAQGYAQTPGSYIPLGSTGHAIVDPSVSVDTYNTHRVSGTVTGTDNGVAILTLGGSSPWSFQFGGISYGQIAVSVDGFISLQGTQNSCGCLSSTDPNAPPACGAGYSNCAAGCGPAVAGAVGCCAIDDACTAPGNCSFNQTCGGSCCSGCGPTAANFQAFGQAISPSVIAGWMEDLDDTASQGIRYLEGVDVLGAHFLTIDYHGVQTSQAGAVTNACFACSGNTAYNFSITLYQPSGTDGIATVNYGPATTLPGGSDDTCPAFVGAADESFNAPIIPSLTQVENFNNDCFGTECDAVNTFGCQFSCGAWPLDNTLVYYDSAAPTNALVIPAKVQVLNGSYDAGGGFPSLTFGLQTSVNNLGGAKVAGGNLNYDVYLTKAPISGLECTSGFPCLGSFSQAIAAGTLGKFKPNRDGSGVALATGVSVVIPSTLVVAIPPTLGKGLYYAQMTFGAGGPVESAVSDPLEFGPDPAAIALSIPPVPRADGTFTARPSVQNLGYLQEAAFTLSLYLSKDNCADFDATKAPFLGVFHEGPLDPFISPTELSVVTQAPVVPAGGVLLAGSYHVVAVVASADDLNPTNNTVCSTTTIGISPPSLKTENVRAPGLCYVAPPGAGNAHYGCDVSYTVTNEGTELASDFSMGVYLQAYDKGPSPKPLTAAQMYFPDVNPSRGVWGPITLGGGCVMTVSGFGQLVNFNPPGCGVAAGVGNTPGALPPPIAVPQEFPDTTVFGDAHHPLPVDCLIAVYADPDSQLPASSGKEKAASAKTVVSAAGPDLTVFAGDLIAPLDATAGEPMAVNRTIRNVGPIAGGAPYAYYLSSAGLVGTSGIPVPVLTATGVTYFPTTGLLQPPSNAGATAADRDQGADTLILPSGLAAGSYTLTLAVDPLAATPEVLRDNKLQSADSPITVGASAIQVLDTSLPVGVVGEQYPDTRLLATGGFAPYVWSVVAGDLASSGLALAADGLISGTPSQAGDYSFAAQVTSGDQSQLIALFLTVTNASGPLQITSPSPLPPATVGEYYSQQIQAQGGVPPYGWAGQAPGGLSLDPSGLLLGTPGTPTDGLQSFSVTVTDHVGNQVSGTLSVAVVAPSSILISTDASCPANLIQSGKCQASVPALAIGDELNQAFYAYEADGQSHSYTWTFPAGEPLPAGLQPPVQQGQAFVLSGSPTQVGIFPFSLVVADEQQRTSSRQFALVVTSTPFNGGLVKLPSASPGASYGPVSLTTAQGMMPVIWSLYSGELPPNVVVNSDGSIGTPTGMTIPSNATPRTYSFVAAVQTQGGGLALLPASITVVLPAVKSGGCQSASGNFSLTALGLGLLWMRRSGRRRGLASR